MRAFNALVIGTQVGVFNLDRKLKGKGKCLTDSQVGDQRQMTIYLKLRVYIS